MPKINQQHRKIIVIDDDKTILQAYTSVLSSNKGSQDSASNRIAALLEPNKADANEALPHFDLTFAAQGQEGFELIQQAAATGSPFAVAFIDIRMPPGWDGMETAARIREIDPSLEFVIVTAYTDRSREEIVKIVGTPEKLLFLRKPFDPEELYQLALSLSEKWLITKREEEARKALAKSEAKFRDLVETTSDFVWEIDAKGQFVYCSPICETMYGFRQDELLGKPFSTLLTTDEAKKHHLFFEHCRDETEAFHGCQRNCLRKDNTEVTIETNGAPIIDTDGTVTGFRGIDRDITARLRIQEEKQELEEQYHQAQKMEAIGTLAGGIAHDLNNLLTPILGYTEISRMGLNPTCDLAKNMEIIESSAQKAAGLIRQILTFSRKQILSPEVFDVNDLVNGFIKMLRRMIREDIELHLDLTDQLCSIRMDKGQVEQILMNLVVNARDAIDKNGNITIHTSNVEIDLDQEIVDNEGTLFAGNYIVIAVDDNGTGMSKETIQRIFDPFYTTKAIGQGTGLGLATVYGIAKQHDGHILIDSIPNEGSTFSIYLPRTEKEMPQQPSTVKPIQGGHETILLAEDDTAVRDLALLMLEDLGYNLLSASNGKEAMTRFKEADGRIDLLMTDVIMPGMGGADLVASLRHEHPDLPVLFVSGYPRDMTKDSLMDAPNTDFIQKPFILDAMATKIRSLLSKEED